MITEEINNALTTLSISESNFNLLSDDEGEKLYYELLDLFVTGGDRRWWWESFKNSSKSISYEDDNGFLQITKIVPDTKEPVWFIAEDDQLPYYPIYETTPEQIVKVIGECYGFEYYIVPKSKEWILCENHHNRIIGSGSLIESRLC